MSALSHFTNSDVRRRQGTFTHQFKVENQAIRLRNLIMAARECKHNSVIFKDMIFPENKDTLLQNQYTIENETISWSPLVDDV